MESAANFHHQFQDQLVLDSPPSCYGAATNNSWNPIAFLSSSHNFIPTDNNLVPAALGNNPMIQELVGFHCATANNHGGSNPGAGNFGARNNIKDELSEPYPVKFTEMINSPPSSSIEDLHLHLSNFIKNDHHHERYNGQLNPIGGMSRDKVLLTTFSNHGCDVKGLVNHQFPPGEFANYNSADHSQSSCSGITTSTRGGFSQIFPTVNISGPNTNNQSASVPSSLDLFNSARFSGGFTRPSFDINGTNLGGVFKDTCLSYGLDEMQQLSHRPTDNPSKITGLSSYINGGAQGKRSSENIGTKGNQTTSATPIKKSRVESRSSCPPFKVIIQVRKEKLGDRIAALQQLVAPFGKTDTASVLMEAIGYIKLLQNQVEKLSVPYIKTSRAGRGGSVDSGHGEVRRDLKSQGLCLVPLSCLSYMTDGGGGIWPNPILVTYFN